MRLEARSILDVVSGRSGAARMAGIFHTLSINAPVAKVFAAVSLPGGLDRWWTNRCTGTPAVGAEYALLFSPEHSWRAVVSRSVTDVEFELQMTHADAEWVGTRVGFRVRQQGAGTCLEFQHSGWPAASNHFRIASFCWAMYLRLLRRYLELQEEVRFEDRNAV